jgi:hypothetical protein
VTWSLERAWRKDTRERLDIDLDWFADEQPSSRISDVINSVTRALVDDLEIGKSYALDVVIDADFPAGEIQYFTFTDSLLKSLFADDEDDNDC